MTANTHNTHPSYVSQRNGNAWIFFAHHDRNYWPFIYRTCHLGTYTAKVLLTNECYTCDITINCALNYLILDIDECRTGEHNCQQLCNNLPGTYNCSCNTGFTLNYDSRTCRGMTFGHVTHYDCGVDNLLKVTCARWEDKTGTCPFIHASYLSLDTTNDIANPNPNRDPNRNPNPDSISNPNPNPNPKIKFGWING